MGERLLVVEQMNAGGRYEVYDVVAGDNKCR